MLGFEPKHLKIHLLLNDFHNPNYKYPLTQKQTTTSTLPHNIILYQSQIHQIIWNCNNNNFIKKGHVSLNYRKKWEYRTHDTDNQILLLEIWLGGSVHWWLNFIA